MSARNFQRSRGAKSTKDGNNGLKGRLSRAAAAGAFRHFTFARPRFRSGPHRMTAAPVPKDPVVPAGRWARALAGEKEPLQDLAGSYWYCVYAWWRRAGLEPARAETATLASWTRWLSTEPPTLDQAHADRLREWLPARLAEQAEHGVKLMTTAAVQIDAAWAERRFADEPAGEANAILQRRWALTVLEFAVAALKAEYEARGEAALFAEVLPFAGFGQSGEEAYAEAAGRTGKSTSAMRKAVFDFRTRQRELLRALAADTVANPGDLESEMTALLLACDAAGPGSGSAPLPSLLQAIPPDQMLARAMASVKMSTAGAHGWEPPTPAEVARLFPNYTDFEMLGRGGMGAVYKACQTSLDRCVAIKLLPLEISVDRDFADRFRREARAMAKLNHPNIISVFDFGQTSEGHLYFVMEFVDGAMLHDLIHKADPLPPGEALGLIEQVCDALAYAHGKGIVHRDVKPSNVMVEREGRVKVADFGLARLTDAASAEQWGTTMTGIVMGTPDYMSPEQKRGSHVDHRADIYALGVMLYEALCKETPQGAFELPSQRCGVDKRLDAVITKSLKQQADARYQSTLEMKTAIAAIRPAVTKADAKKAPAKAKSNGAPTIAAPPAPKQPTSIKPTKSKAPIFVAVAVVLALLAGGAWFLHSPKPKREDDLSPTAERKEASSTAAAEAWRPAVLARGSWVTNEEGLVLQKQGNWKIQNAPSRDGAVRVRMVYSPDFWSFHLVARKQGDQQYLFGLSAHKLQRRDGGSFVSPDRLRAKMEPVLVAGQEVTFELRVVGHQLTGTIDGQVVAEAEDDHLAAGDFAVEWGNQDRLVLRSLEVLNLDVAVPAATAAQTPAPGEPVPPALPRVPPGASAISPPTMGNPVELIPLIDVKRDGVAGTWLLENGVLKGEGGYARLMLPFTAPAEYDFRVRFSRQSGKAVAQRVVHAGHAAMWLMGAFGNDLWTFEQINGQAGRENSKAIKTGLEDGRTYKSIVKVRREAVQVAVDGKLVYERATDGTDFSTVPAWAFPDPTKLGIGCQGTATFQQITVTPMAGSPAVSPPVQGASAPPAAWQPLIPNKGWVTNAEGILLTQNDLWLAKNSPARDGAVRLRASFDPARFASLRLLVRSRDGAFYQFGYSADSQKAIIQQKVGGTFSPMAKVRLTPLSPALQPGAEVVLEFRVVGERLIGRVNGQIVAEADGATLPGGNVGLSKGSGDAVQLKSVEVLNLDAAPAQPGLGAQADAPPSAGKTPAAADPSAEPWQDLLRSPEKLHLLNEAELTGGTLRLPKNGAVASVTGSSTAEDGAIRVTATYSGEGFGLAVHARNGGKSQYLIKPKDAGHVSLVRVNDKGEWIYLRTYSLAAPLHDGDALTLELRVVGDKLTASAQGALLGEEHDATLRAGSFGVESRSGSVVLTAMSYLPLTKASAATPATSPTSGRSNSPATATKETPFENSLGMRFVPVPITGGPTKDQRVLFSIWETRVQDYDAFVTETKREWPKPKFEQGPAHPAVNVSWTDTQAFCQWLTARERQAGRLSAHESYRLPSDHEWTCAIGLGDREDAARTPEQKNRRLPDFAWGTDWPPPADAGNLSGEETIGRPAADFQDVRSKGIAMPSPSRPRSEVSRRTGLASSIS